MVNYEDVISSNIRALGWQKGVGYVWFGNGRRFAYKMEKALFDQMKAAASIGSFFSRMVRKECPVVWSGWGCDNSPCRADAELIGTIQPGMQFRCCSACSKEPRLEKVTFEPLPEEPVK